MCIVIDENVITKYFNIYDANHYIYAPLEDWRQRKNRVIVFGGSKYLEEVSKSHRYLKHLRELEKINGAIELERVKVDIRKYEIDQITKETDCNDSHIIALIDCCKAKILCTLDGKSLKYITDNGLYKSNHPPFIYKKPEQIRSLYNRKYQECRGPCCNPN